jgi:hypothetical protein
MPPLEPLQAVEQFYSCEVVTTTAKRLKSVYIQVYIPSTVSGNAPIEREHMHHVLRTFCGRLCPHLHTTGPSFVQKLYSRSVYRRIRSHLSKRLNSPEQFPPTRRTTCDQWRCGAQFSIKQSVGGLRILVHRHFEKEASWDDCEWLSEIERTASKTPREGIRLRGGVRGLRNTFS